MTHRDQRPTDSGVAVWSSSEWQCEATAWLDDQLSASGMERSVDVESPHIRPWATVLRAPTSGGVMWLKAASPATAFETLVSLLDGSYVGGA